MTDNLYALFESRFPADPTSWVLQETGGRQWSYGDLERETARLANLFAALGLAPGDRVAVQVEKSPRALFTYLATLRAGLVYLPLNAAYQPAEVEYFLRDAEPRLVVGRPQTESVIAPLARACGAPNYFTLDDDGGGALADAAAGQPDAFETVARTAQDLAAILYTSGTTGRSKGAMLTHGNLASNALTLHRSWGFVADDILLHALPIFHVHGLFVATHCVLLNGTGMLWHARFDAARVMQDLPRATVLMGVPTFYTRLLGRPDLDRQSCAHMRLFVSGSAPLLTETFETFKARTGHVILERYGMTETGMNTSNPLHGERRAGTVGPALPDVGVRVVDDADAPLPCGQIGHIQVRGPNVFPGYWRRPERNADEFTEDGWFRTGDVGQLAADGYLTIVGRSKDLVISGGYNVYPKEIETCIDALPGVAESAVFGVPHPDFGEAVKAAVVMRPGAAPLSEAAVIATLRSQLANFKVPKQVVFLDDLPRNAMGKVQKNVLRATYGG